MINHVQRNPFASHEETSPTTRQLPVMSSSNKSSESPKHDPMDLTSPTARMGPPRSKDSPEADQGSFNGSANGAETPTGVNTSPNQALGAAAAAAQGPKVVQTAFIHKLYKYDQPSQTPFGSLANSLVSMLEDKSIQHLISWSSNNDSFVMSPSNEFSKVLAYAHPGATMSKQNLTETGNISSTPIFLRLSDN